MIRAATLLLRETEGYEEETPTLYTQDVDLVADPSCIP